MERQQSENENREARASAASVQEEELNVEESSAGGDGDDLVQPNNDVTGDHGNASPVLAATAIPTSEVVGGKKRSREAESSSRRSKKRVKLHILQCMQHQKRQDLHTKWMEYYFDH